MNLEEAVEQTYRRYWKNTKSELDSLRNAKDVSARLGNIPVRSINESKIDQLVYSLEKDNKAPATVNRKLAALSRMLRYCYKRGYIDRIPIIERQREPVGRLRWLSEEEEHQLLTLFGELDRPAMKEYVTILIDTGARCGELFKLRWKDIDFDRRLIRFNNTKNGGSRSVPMTNRVVQCFKNVRTHQQDRMWMFNQNVFSKVWNKVRALMGMSFDPEFVPHMLRHTCASRLVQRGVELSVVKEWLGHSSITTTMRYAHLSSKNLTDACAVLEQ